MLIPFCEAVGRFACSNFKILLCRSSRVFGSDFIMAFAVRHFNSWTRRRCSVYSN